MYIKKSSTMFIGTICKFNNYYKSKHFYITLDAIDNIDDLKFITIKYDYENYKLKNEYQFS
jgi:hypothetical protein